jgi:hypothetical protein
MTRDDIEGKYLPADRLRDLLATLPEGSLIQANRVGNLSVLNAAGVPIGFVDLLMQGEVEMYEPETGT